MHDQPATSEDGIGPFIYHIADSNDWTESVARGSYEGSALCRRDGFIHLSTEKQALQTWRVHYAPRLDGLILLRIARNRLGDALKFEVSRDGQVFPHLYRALRPNECEPMAIDDLPGFAEIGSNT